MKSFDELGFSVDVLGNVFRVLFVSVELFEDLDGGIEVLIYFVFFLL